LVYLYSTIFLDIVVLLTDTYTYCYLTLLTYVPSSAIILFFFFSLNPKFPASYPWGYAYAMLGNTVLDDRYPHKTYQVSIGRFYFRSCLMGFRTTSDTFTLLVCRKPRKTSNITPCRHHISLERAATEKKKGAAGTQVIVGLGYWQPSFQRWSFVSEIGDGLICRVIVSGWRSADGPFRAVYGVSKIGFKMWECVGGWNFSVFQSIVRGALFSLTT